MAIQRYKRRIGISEAIQYDGTNLDEIMAWCPIAEKSGDNVKLNYPAGTSADDIVIKTGDYIVKMYPSGNFVPGRAQDHGYASFSDIWDSVPTA